MTNIKLHTNERGSNIEMSKLYVMMAFALAAMMLFGVSAVLAEETSDSVIAPAPAEDSSTTSTAIDAETQAELDDELDESAGPVKMGWENAKLWLTFNNEKKAQQELRIAKLRLIQAKIAAENNNTVAMERALEAHNRILEKVQARINAIDGASTDEGARNAAEKLVAMQKAIEVHEARISKLNALLASENLTDDQRAVLEKRLEQAQNNTEHLKEVQAEKKEKIKTKLRAATNLTEEEADVVIENIEDKENLRGLQNAIAKVKAEHAKEVLQRVQERQQFRNEIREQIQNSNLTFEERQALRNQVRNEMRETVNEETQENAGSDEEESETETESENETESESEAENQAVNAGQSGNQTA